MPSPLCAITRTARSTPTSTPQAWCFPPWADSTLTSRTPLPSSPGITPAFQTDTVVVAGRWQEQRPGGRYFAVARFNLNGSLDTTFDQDGKVTTPIAADNYGATA